MQGERPGAGPSDAEQDGDRQFLGGCVCGGVCVSGTGSFL